MTQSCSSHTARLEQLLSCLSLFNTHTRSLPYEDSCAYVSQDYWKEGLHMGISQCVVAQVITVSTSVHSPMKEEAKTNKNNI